MILNLFNGTIVHHILIPVLILHRVKIWYCLQYHYDANQFLSTNFIVYLWKKMFFFVIFVFLALELNYLYCYFGECLSKTLLWGYPIFVGDVTIVFTYLVIIYNFITDWGSYYFSILYTYILVEFLTYLWWQVIKLMLKTLCLHLFIPDQHYLLMMCHSYFIWISYLPCFS